MFSEEQMIEIEQMGIVVCKKTFTVKYFSPNRYASYVASRLKLICNKEDFYTYNTGVWIKLNEKYLLAKLRNRLHKYLDDIWTLKREKEYVEALKRLVFYDGELNSNKRYINLINGMYDLEEFKLVEHHPEFYSTIRIPIEYDENAKCPNFMNFTDQCFLGDEESKRLAQEWVGYLLTAETKAQKGLILYGEGANGKGVFIDAASYLIGQENISSILHFKNIIKEENRDRYLKEKLMGDIEKIEELFIIHLKSGQKLMAWRDMLK